MNYIGNLLSGARADFEVTTVDSTGATTAATSFSVCVRKLSATTVAAGVLATNGVMLTTSGGQYHVTVFTGSDSTFFATGNDYHVFVGFGIVSGVAIHGYSIGHFSIQNRGLMATERDAIADAIILRDIATGSSASTTRSVQAALRMIANRSAITGINNPYTLTFYAENDTSAFQTAAVTFSANTFGISDANPT